MYVLNYVKPYELWLVFVWAHRHARAAEATEEDDPGVRTQSATAANTCQMVMGKRQKTHESCPGMASPVAAASPLA